MTTPCPEPPCDCASMQAQITELEELNAALLARIACLEGVIITAMNICQDTIKKSDSVLNKGGVARGVWSYNKGAKETALLVLKNLHLC